MLMPRRVKHRKVQRGRMSGLAKGGFSIVVSWESGAWSSDFLALSS